MIIDKGWRNFPEQILLQCHSADLTSSMD
jgi:hypothetical protein